MAAGHFLHWDTRTCSAHGHVGAICKYRHILLTEAGFARGFLDMWKRFAHRHVLHTDRDAMCTWTNGHILHVDIHCTWTRVFQDTCTGLHTDPFCTWTHGTVCTRTNILHTNIHSSRKARGGDRGVGRRWPRRGAGPGPSREPHRRGGELQLPALSHLGRTRGDAERPRPAGGAFPAQVPAAVRVAEPRTGTPEPVLWSPALWTAASWVTWVRARRRGRGAGSGDQELHLVTFTPSGDASCSEGWPGASGGDWVGSEGRAVKGTGPGVQCSSDAVSASRSRFPRRPARRRAGHPCDLRTVELPPTPREPSNLGRMRGCAWSLPGSEENLGSARVGPLAALVPGLEQTAFQAPSGRVVRGVVSILRRHQESDQEGVCARVALCETCDLDSSLSLP